MRFHNLDINPAKNPAILDTGTWDPGSALRTIQQLSKEYLEKVSAASGTEGDMPACDGFVPYGTSLSRRDGRVVFLAGLPDGQQVFVEIGERVSKPLLCEPLGRIELNNGKRLDVHKTDAAVLDRFFRKVNPARGSSALGDTPRLGIGVRMTTACWPAILTVMQKKNFSANMIQNSVRELNFMSTLLDGEPPETNYACGFGTIETGYTGSSFEGLWVSGVLEALKHTSNAAYGADADHLQVKRGPEGLGRAKRLIDSCRYYSFYTIDMADMLGYEALQETSDSAAEEYLAQKIPDSALRQELLGYHRQSRRIAGKKYSLDPTAFSRLAGKYWDALQVLEELTEYIRQIKKGQAFDLEFTIDEHPPEIKAFDCLTTEEEIIFVLMELERRGLPVTHIAPNFGLEKGVDYRCPDGLDGFEKRVTAQFRIAEEFGVMLDFHSADDLTSGPRRIIRKTTGGKHHFKISPMPQIIFADVLSDFHPELFRQWWDDAMAYAGKEAAAGSEFAKECIKDYDESDDKAPSHRHMAFHHYGFAFVGRRDEKGQFLHRERFYDLSREFYDEYQNRLIDYLGGLADELF